MIILEPEDSVRLVVRRDGTWDYRYAIGFNDGVVLELLKQVVGQLESGAYIAND